MWMWMLWMVLLSCLSGAELLLDHFSRDLLSGAPVRWYRRSGVFAHSFDEHSRGRESSSSSRSWSSKGRAQSLQVERRTSSSSSSDGGGGGGGSDRLCAHLLARTVAVVAVVAVTVVSCHSRWRLSLAIGAGQCGRTCRAPSASGRGRPRRGGRRARCRDGEAASGASSSSSSSSQSSRREERRRRPSR